MVRSSIRAYASFRKIYDTIPIKVETVSTSTTPQTGPETTSFPSFIMRGGSRGTLVQNGIAVIVNKDLPNASILTDPFDDNSFGWSIPGIISGGVMDVGDALRLAGGTTFLQFGGAPVSSENIDPDRSNAVLVKAGETLTPAKRVEFYSDPDVAATGSRFAVYNDAGTYRLQKSADGGTSWTNIRKITNETDAGDSVASFLMAGLTPVITSNADPTLNTNMPSGIKADLSQAGTAAGTVTISIEGVDYTTGVVASEVLTIVAPALTVSSAIVWETISKITVVSDKASDNYFTTTVSTLANIIYEKTDYVLDLVSNDTLLKMYLEDATRANLYYTSGADGQGAQTLISDLPIENGVQSTATSPGTDRFYIDSNETATTFDLKTYHYIYSNNILFDFDISFQEIFDIYTNPSVNGAKYTFSGRPDVDIYRVIFGNNDSVEVLGLKESFEVDTIYFEGSFSTRNQVVDYVNAFSVPLAVIDAKFVDPTSSEYLLDTFTDVRVLTVGGISPLLSAFATVTNEVLTSQSDGTNLNYELGNSPVFSETVQSGLALPLGVPGADNVAATLTQTAADTHLGLKFTGAAVGNISVAITGRSAGNPSADPTDYAVAGFTIPAASAIDGAVIPLLEDSASTRLYSKELTGKIWSDGVETGTVDIVTINMFDLQFDTGTGFSIVDVFAETATNPMARVDNANGEFWLTTAPADNVGVIVSSYFHAVSTGNYPLFRSEQQIAATSAVSVDDEGSMFVAQNTAKKLNALMWGQDDTDADLVHPLPINEEYNAVRIINAASLDTTISDGGGSITIDANDLDIRDLTPGTDQVGAQLFDQGTGDVITSILEGEGVRSQDVHNTAEDSGQFSNGLLNGAETTIEDNIAAPVATEEVGRDAGGNDVRAATIYASGLTGVLASQSNWLTGIEINVANASGTIPVPTATQDFPLRVELQSIDPATGDPTGRKLTRDAFVYIDNEVAQTSGRTGKVYFRRPVLLQEGQPFAVVILVDDNELSSDYSDGDVFNVYYNAVASSIGGLGYTYSGTIGGSGTWTAIATANKYLCDLITVRDDITATTSGSKTGMDVNIMGGSISVLVNEYIDATVLPVSHESPLAAALYQPGGFSAAIPGVDRTYYLRCDSAGRLMTTASGAISSDVQGLYVHDAAATLAGKPVMLGGRGQSTPDAQADVDVGDACFLVTNLDGRLFVVPTGEIDEATPQGTVYPVVVGGKAIGTFPAYTDGDQAQIHTDLRGKLIVDDADMGFLENLDIDNGAGGNIVANGSFNEFDLAGAGSDDLEIVAVILTQLTGATADFTFQIWEKASAGYDPSVRVDQYLNIVTIDTTEVTSSTPVVMDYRDRDGTGEIHCRLINNTGGTDSKFQAVVKFRRKTGE